MPREILLLLDDSDYRALKKEKNMLRVTWREYILHKCLGRKI